MNNTLTNDEKSRAEKMYRAYMQKTLEKAPNKAKLAFEASNQLRSLYMDMKRQGRLGEFKKARQSILAGREYGRESPTRRVKQLETKVICLESRLVLEQTR